MLTCIIYGYPYNSPPPGQPLTVQSPHLMVCEFRKWCLQLAQWLHTDRTTFDDAGRQGNCGPIGKSLPVGKPLYPCSMTTLLLNSLFCHFGRSYATTTLARNLGRRAGTYEGCVTYYCTVETCMEPLSHAVLCTFLSGHLLCCARSCLDFCVFARMDRLSVHREY